MACADGWPVLAGEYIAVEKVEAVYKKNALVEQARPCMRKASALSRRPALALCTVRGKHSASQNKAELSRPSDVSW